jgi:hypothetical protein
MRSEPPARKMVKPPDVTQQTWDAVITMQKNRKKRPKSARMAA